jgi:hypothetical protein
VLSGARSEAEALAEYERKRNKATIGDFHANFAYAQLLPPPLEVAEARAAMRGDQEATNRFYLLQEGLLD